MVEVFKGPSSIKYGPYTVGGAINLVSRDIPSGTGDYDNGSLDLGLGSYGFKELDGGGDTDFDKNDVIMKMLFNSDPHVAIYH